MSATYSTFSWESSPNRKSGMLWILFFCKYLKRNNLCQLLFNRFLKYVMFSNSLIIHQAKTKEIITVTMVWLAYIFTILFLRLHSVVLVSIGKIYQTLETVFHHISKHFEFRQKYCASYFQLSSQCLEMWWNTVFPIWYITNEIFSQVRIHNLCDSTSDFFTNTGIQNHGYWLSVLETRNRTITALGHQDANGFNLG